MNQAAAQLGLQRRRRHAVANGGARVQSALVTTRAISMLIDRPLKPEQTETARDAETVRIARALLRGEIGLALAPVVSSQVIASTAQPVQRFQWNVVDRRGVLVLDLGQSELPR